MHVLPLILLAAAAPTAPKPFTFVTSVEGVHEYRLPNGLQVLLMPDSSKNTVTVNMTVFVGSRHEGYGEKGMAHLLEHMLFKGTPTTKAPNEALTAHGADANGTTSDDRTNYYETLPASDKNLEWAIRFEADRLVNCFVAKKDLDTEMTVVRNEFEQSQNEPHGVLFEQMLASAYQWHSYGNATIGNQADIERVPIDRLQAFYKKHYRPDNAMLVVAGKLEPAKTFKWIADSFGKLKAPKEKLPATYTREPVQDGEHAVTVRRIGGIPILMTLYHVPAGTDPDFPALEVLADVLGDSPSGRLYKALVETKKAARVTCEAVQLREPGYLFCAAELKAGDNVDAAKQALISTLETLEKKPVTQEETERARTRRVKELELVMNAADRVGLMLSESAALGDWRLLFSHRDALKKVAPESVTRVAGRYLKQSNRTLGEYVPTEKPDRVEIPDLVDIAAVLKDYKSEAGLSEGETFDATPKNLEARTQRLAIDEGFKLALLPKKTRGEKVNGLLVLRYGTLESLTQQQFRANLVAKMLVRGTAKRTRQQFEDALDKLNAQVHVATAPQGVTVSFEVRRPALEETLALIVEALRTPAFDPKEFETLRGETQASLTEQSSDPVALGFNELQRRAAPYPLGHPLATPSFSENLAELKAVTLEQLKAFHARHYGAQQLQLSVVGDFEAEKLTAQAKTLLQGWKAPQAFARLSQPYQPVAPGMAAIPTPDKKNAFYGVAMALPMRDSDPDYAAMMLGDYLLGGGVLAGRITDRLREKEGLSYGSGTFFRAPALDDGALEFAYAIYAPENFEKVERAIREELERAVAKGFDDKELATSRSGLLQEREHQRAEDSQLCLTLANQTFLGRDFSFEEKLDAQLEALKAKDVSAAVKKWLDPKKATAVKSGDFKTLPVPK